jgi:hypothetical protein
MTQQLLEVKGSGGGGGSGGKGGAGGSGTEATNTLRSTTKASLVELISEGECVGLVLADGTPVDDSNRGQAIFFDATPVQNADGSFNYNGLVATQRTGLPDQDYVNGFNKAETPFQVGVQVKVSTGPVVHTIVDPLVDAVRVISRLPALAYQDKESGNLSASSVSYAFDVRSFGGSWVEVVTVNIENQKCTSPYQQSHLITLPRGGAPWNLRMRRVTADSTVVELQNETWWDSYSEIIQGRFTYPDSALVALTIDASTFGGSIPSRSYRWRGIKTLVPSNYNPETRVYTGVWDGTFKKAWHNNPAWVFHDILTNARYGLGEFVAGTTVDKWGLYTIGRYCDGLVPSGVVDDANNDIMEPRFVFNGVINNRAEAYKVLQDVAATFRGMAYWSLGQVFASADIPSDPVTTVSPANVIDGHFKYSGTAMKARHSVALVSWNDPADFYRPAIEVTQSDEMLYRFGWRQVEVAPIGTTSRGQAHRYGKWILDTEQYETETIQFTMSWDGFVLQNGITLKPGDIILVSDPRKTGGVRTGGRLKSGGLSQVTLDFPFEPLSGSSYNITVIMPDGTIETKNILSFSNANKTVALSDAFSVAPKKGANFVIQGTDVVARRYRVMAVRETDKHLFEISGLFSDPNKYERVENGVAFDPINYTRPKNIVKGPTNLSVVETRYFQNGVSHSRATLSWSAPNDFLTVDYYVTADTPRGFLALGATKANSIDVNDPIAGAWRFYVTARSRTGVPSLPVTFDFTVEGWEAVEGPIVTGLTTTDGNDQFAGNAPTLIWENQFPADAVVYALKNVVRVYDVGGQLLRTEIVSQNSFTYSLEMNTNDGGPRRHLAFEVSCLTVVGAETTPASITIANPAPAAVTPTVTSNGPQILAKWSVADNDYAGSMIWVSMNAGFNPLLTTPAYDGPDTQYENFVTLPGVYYVRVAAYDSFGKSGLTVGPVVAVSATGLDLAAFNKRVRDLVSAEFKAVSDPAIEIEGVIVESEGLIASVIKKVNSIAAVAAERDAKSFTDKTIVRTELKVAKDDISASIEDVRTVAIDTQGALAEFETTATTQFGDLSSSVSTLGTSISTLTTAFGSYSTTVNAHLGSIDGHLTTVDSLVSTNSTAIASLGSAFGSYQTTVNVHLSDLDTGKASTASVATLSTAFADLNTSFGSYQTTVNAHLTDLDTNKASNASVTTVSNALTTQAGAFGSYQTTVNAHLDALDTGKASNASVTTVSDAVALTNGKLAAGYSTVLDVNGYVSSMKAFNDGSFSSWNFVGTAFGVAFPGISGGAPVQIFTVAAVNGVPKVAIRGDVIADGTITTNALVAGAVTAVKMAAGSITADKIAAGTITADRIIANGVSMIWATTGGFTGAAGGDLISLPFTPTVGRCVIHAECDVDVGLTAGSGRGAGYMQLYVDGVLVATRTLGWYAVGGNNSVPDGTASMYFACTGSVHLMAQVDLSPDVSHTALIKVSTAHSSVGSFSGGNIVINEARR